MKIIYKNKTNKQMNKNIYNFKIKNFFNKKTLKFEFQMRNINK